MNKFHLILAKAISFMQNDPNFMKHYQSGAIIRAMWQEF
jgi:hypothetical protein